MKAKEKEMKEEKEATRKVGSSFASFVGQDKS